MQSLSASNSSLHNRKPLSDYPVEDFDTDTHATYRRTLRPGYEDNESSTRSLNNDNERDNAHHGYDEIKIKTPVAHNARPLLDGKDEDFSIKAHAAHNRRLLSDCKGEEFGTRSVSSNKRKPLFDFDEDDFAASTRRNRARKRVWHLDSDIPQTDTHNINKRKPLPEFDEFDSTIRNKGEKKASCDVGTAEPSVHRPRLLQKWDQAADAARNEQGSACARNSDVDKLRSKRCRDIKKLLVLDDFDVLDDPILKPRLVTDLNHNLDARSQKAWYKKSLSGLEDGSSGHTSKHVQPFSGFDLDMIARAQAAPTCRPLPDFDDDFDTRTCRSLGRGVVLGFDKRCDTRIPCCPDPSSISLGMRFSKVETDTFEQKKRHLDGSHLRSSPFSLHHKPFSAIENEGAMPTKQHNNIPQSSSAQSFLQRRPLSDIETERHTPTGIEGVHPSEQQGLYTVSMPSFKRVSTVVDYLKAPRNKNHDGLHPSSTNFNSGRKPASELEVKLTSKKGQPYGGKGFGGLLDNVPLDQLEFLLPTKFVPGVIAPPTFLAGMIAPPTSLRV